MAVVLFSNFALLLRLFVIGKIFVLPFPFPLDPFRSLSALSLGCRVVLIFFMIFVAIFSFPSGLEVVLLPFFRATLAPTDCFR